jgi:hypothetical protein
MEVVISWYGIALFWGFLGWVLRVVFTYYKYSKNIEAQTGKRFVWKTYRKKFDQDWIMGFVGMVVFSLIADWFWSAGLSEWITSKESDYDPKVNVIIGYMAIFIAEKLAGKENE